MEVTAIELSDALAHLPSVNEFRGPTFRWCVREPVMFDVRTEARILTFRKVRRPSGDAWALDVLT